MEPPRSVGDAFSTRTRKVNEGGGQTPCDAANKKHENCLTSELFAGRIEFNTATVTYEFSSRFLWRHGDEDTHTATAKND